MTSNLARVASLLSALAALSSIACGGGSDGPPLPGMQQGDGSAEESSTSTSPDGVTPSAGTLTGSLEMTVTIEVGLFKTSNGDTYTYSAWAYVGGVIPNTEKSITDATVTVTPIGQAPVKLTSTGPGIPYQAQLPGAWAPGYKVSFESSSGSRTGIVLASPGKFDIALDPVPKIGQATMLTWSPSGDSNVSVAASVGATAESGWRSAAGPDTGSVEVPGSAFSASPVTISVDRSRGLIAQPLFSGSVLVAVTVESLDLD